MKCVRNNLFIMVFFILYLGLIDFVWQYVPIQSPVGVLTGNVFVLVISFLFSIMTVQKIIMKYRLRNCRISVKE